MRKAWFPSGTKLFVFGLLLSLVNGGVSSAASGENSSQIQLEVTPSTIKLAPSEKELITISARNNTKSPAENLRLEWIVTSGLVVKARSNEKEQLLPVGASTRWSLDVTQASDSTESGHVYFLLDYVQRESNTTTSMANTVNASLEVQVRSPTTLEKLVDVRAESALKLLKQSDTGTIYVVVKNKSVRPLTVLPLKRDPPDKDLEIISITPNKNIEIPPQAEKTFSVDVKAKNRVKPGKHVLLFPIDITWHEDGHQHRSSIISKYEFDLGVVGDELLTVLGVPTLLLLPGFLAILIFTMLWNHVGTRTRIPLDLKSGEFWSIAVLVSLSATLLYRLTWNDNYPDRYGLDDVYFIWFGSAAVGAGAWAAAVLFVWLWKAGRRWYYTFAPSDGPIDVLRKLARNKRGFQLEQVDVHLGGKDQRAVVLDRNGDITWVAPEILVGVRDNLDPQDKSILQTTLQGCVAATDAPRELADFLEKEKSRLEIKWCASDVLGGVKEVKETKSVNATARSMVRIAV
jgi:hypothetical protein